MTSPTQAACHLINQVPTARRLRTNAVKVGRYEVEFTKCWPNKLTIHTRDKSGNIEHATDQTLDQGMGFLRNLGVLV